MEAYEPSKCFTTDCKKETRKNLECVKCKGEFCEECCEKYCKAPCCGECKVNLEKIELHVIYPGYYLCTKCYESNYIECSKCHGPIIRDGDDDYYCGKCGVLFCQSCFFKHKKRKLEKCPFYWPYKTKKRKMKEDTVKNKRKQMKLNSKEDID